MKYEETINQNLLDENIKLQKNNIVIGEVTTNKIQKGIKNLCTTRLENIPRETILDCFKIVESSNTIPIVGFKYSKKKARITFFTKKEDGMLDTIKWHLIKSNPIKSSLYKEVEIAKQMQYVSKIETSKNANYLSVRDIINELENEYRSIKSFENNWKQNANDICNGKWNRYKTIAINDVEKNDGTISFAIVINSSCGRSVHAVYNVVAAKAVLKTGYVNDKLNSVGTLEEDIYPLHKYLQEQLDSLALFYTNHEEFYEKYSYYKISNSNFIFKFNEMSASLRDDRIDPVNVYVKEDYTTASSVVRRCNFETNNKSFLNEWKKMYPIICKNLYIEKNKLPNFITENHIQNQKNKIKEKVLIK